MALSAQQQMFVDEYLRTFNATEAYMAAYPNTKRSTGASNGYRLLKENADIAELIRLRLTESAMSADEVLMRLAEHARGDMGNFVNSRGELDLTAIADPQKSRLIKKLTQKRTIRTSVKGDDVEETVTSVELYDAQAALGLIGKQHNLFVDKSENRHYDIDLSKLTNEQLERVAAGEDVLKVIVDGYIAANQSTG